MINKKHIFVILHYNQKSLIDTYECVESIKKNLKNDFFKIIIVENGSKDESYQELCDRYMGDKFIEIIASDENLGFARGNNLGCSFAVNKYNPDFLIVINNDTIIEQKEFLKKIEQKYKKLRFDILGPYIYDRNGKPQNPVLTLKTNLEEVEILLQQSIKKLNSLENDIFKVNKLKQYIKNYLKKLKIIKKILVNKSNNTDISKKEAINIGLHGAAIIFSKDYLKKFKDIFYSKTFMYAEEDILYNRVLKEKLISVYYPEIYIYHKEDKSTEAILGTNLEKQKFILKNSINSLRIYRGILLKEKQEKEKRKSL